MALKNDWLFDALPVLRRLPDGTWFDNGRHAGSLEVQADTLRAVRGITSAFPGAVWQKMWSAGYKWWEYVTIFEGTRIRIYGVREGPRACTAIFETRLVERQVPVTFETQRVEERVLVGWDCGEMNDGESADLGLVVAPENEA